MTSKRYKRERDARRYADMLPTNHTRFAMNTGQYQQSARVSMYEKLIEMLAVSRFKWTGLPEGIPERFIELTLFERGLVVFFIDKSLHRYMATWANYSGSINTYLEPTRFTPQGNNYWYKTLDSKECVPIWDNQLRAPMLDVMFIYAQRLALLDRALDISLENMSVPLIIACTEEQRLTVENMFRQREEGIPVILTTDGTEIMNDVRVFPNNSQSNLDKILQAKAQIWNECVKFLGIENANNEKKERLITDEVQAGSETTDVFRLSFLKSRQQACDTINSLFGTTIGVDWSNVVTGGMFDVTGGNDNE